MNVSDGLPFFKNLPVSLQERLKSQATVRTYDVDAVLTDDAHLCEHLFVVESGLIRVHRTDEQGRTVTLYDVGKHQVCMKNLSCMTGNVPYEARAVAKMKTTVVMIPRKIVVNHLFEAKAFVLFMLKSTMVTMDEMIGHYEAMSFSPVGRRLALYLRKRSAQFKIRTLYVTHMEIAMEIGTSREVVSRHLKGLEDEGYISLTRGKIKIDNIWSVM